MKRNTLYSLTSKAIVSMALVVFVGCQRDPGDIGLPYVDGDQLNFGAMEMTPIRTYTVPFDSVRSNSPTSGIGLVGGYDDVDFGRTDCQIVTHLIPSGVPSFGTNPVCDSAILFIPYTYTSASYYGDTMAPFNITIHALRDYLDPDSNYYSNAEFPVDLEMANTTINVRPRTVRDYDHLSGARPTMRVPVSSQYVENVFFPLESSNSFDNQSTFINAFYGIKISGDASNQAIIGLLVPSTDTKLRMYFRNDEMDTAYYDLRMGTSAEFVNLFQHDYSTASFNLDMQDTVNGESVFYTQTMAGVVGAIEIPDMSKYQDSGWLLLRAELNLPVQEGSATSHRLPEKMQIAIDDTAGRKTTYDLIYESGYIDGNLVTGDLRDNNYNFVITRQIQRFLDKKDYVGRFLIIPDISSSDQARAVLNGNNATLEPAELKLYFSRTK